MRLLAIVCGLCNIFLGGCANPGGESHNPFEALDPAPFDPIETGVPIGSNKISSTDLFNYAGLEDANTKLLALARAYGHHRDNVMQGTTIFYDVPLVGLAVTGVVAVVNHFATTTILGMGVAAGGVLGSRAYMGTSTKAAAYQAAETGLNCLATVARRLEAVSPQQGLSILVELQQRLAPLLQSPAPEMPPPAASPSDITAAAKAVADLQFALDSLPPDTTHAAPATYDLSSAAESIVQNATKRAATGLQDINALVKAIESTGAGTTTGTSKSSGAGQAAALTRTYEGLSLTDLTAQASTLSRSIHSVLDEIPSCVASSSS